MDSRLTEFNAHEVIRLIQVALLCTQASAALRPTMSRVVAMLTGDAGIDTDISKPSYLTELGYRDMANLNEGNVQDGNAVALHPVNDPLFPSPYSVSELPVSDIITEGR